MKVILTGIIIMHILSSCGSEERLVFRSPAPKYTQVTNYGLACIDGVEYLKSGTQDYHKVGYIAPHFKRDGTLYLCGELKGKLKDKK